MADTKFIPVPGVHVYEFTNGDRAIEFFSSHEVVLLSVFHPMSLQWGLFSPEYDKLAGKIALDGIATARLDISDGDAVVDLCQKIRVPRVPTLVLFNGPDRFKVYRGILREKEILEYLARQKSPTVRNLDAASLKDLREEKSVVVAAFLGPGESTARDQFAEVASQLKDDCDFAATTDPAAIQAEGFSVPSVIVFKKTAEERTVIPSWDSQDNLCSLIKTATTPTVVEFLPELYADFLTNPISLLGYLILPSYNLTRTTHNAILPLARTHRSKILFGTVIGPENTRITENMLVPDDQYPFFVLHDTSTNLKYHLTSGSIAPEDIAAFIEDYFAGKLEPVMKSQPIPEKRQGPLVEVVGLTYKEIVLDDEKDVFVEYYDPDCAPCLTIVPQLERFAEAVAADEKRRRLVTVAKMDLDANDALDSDIRGFPTIKLYPAGNKGQPVCYDGEQGHSVQKWARFLRENGTHGVDVEV